jgi:hypothetical protein
MGFQIRARMRQQREPRRVRLRKALSENDVIAFTIVSCCSPVIPRAAMARRSTGSRSGCRQSDG